MESTGNGYKTFDDAGSVEKNKENGSAMAVSTLSDDGKSYTVDEAIEKAGFGLFQIKLSVIAGIAWIADSMELMVLSILGPVLLCQWQLSTTQEALITTIVFVGFTIGSPIMGWIADRYGRKTSLMFAASWAAFYGVLSAASPFYTWLLILRGLTGMGLAGVPQAVTYYSEFLPSKFRGKCIVLLEGFWALGAVLEVVLALLVLEPAGWNWWLMTSSLPLLIFVPACLTCPESPRFLVASGRTEDAQKSLEEVARLNKSSLPAGHLKPEPELPRARLQDLFTPEFKISTILLWVIWFVATFSYYGIILLTTELIQAGTTCVSENEGGIPEPYVGGTCLAGCQGLSHDDYIELLWTSVAEIPGIILTAIYVDYIGRKTSLMINFTLFSVTMFLLFICANNTVMIFLLFVSRALISSALQVAYVYTPELYPTVVRALAIGAANFFARIGAIITPFIAEVLVHKSLAATLSTYGGLGIVAAIATWFLPRETRGEQMKAGL